MFIGLASLRLEPGLAQAQHSQRGPSGDFRLEPCWLGILGPGVVCRFLGTCWLPLLECLVVDLVLCCYRVLVRDRVTAPVVVFLSKVEFASLFSVKICLEGP